MKVHLASFQGNIVKTASIQSNDPDNPIKVLKIDGFIKAIVTITPPNVTLRGSVGRLCESDVDLWATTTPFHIKSIQTNLAGSIHYSLQTVSEGTHYRLKISNKVPQGNYSGLIRLDTDLPQAPYLFVHVIGIIKGEIAATPGTLIIGKLSAGKPVRSGSVSVLSTNGKPFSITGLTYDKGLISVSQKKLEDPNGFLLNIQPKLENIKTGSVKQAHLSVETNAGPGAKARVLVIIFNNSSSQQTRH